MSFRRDLEAWTASQVATRALSGSAEAIRRLLRGDDVGALGPVVSDGLPGEIREAAPPSREVTSTPVPPYSWTCWPSADNAIYGWGDPYEDPPGVPVNPPLGTTQTGWNETAHIVREIHSDDTVIHGVNKFSGRRDWRHDASPLVVSWGDAGAYELMSGGEILLTGDYYSAACVRWDGATPYLIWGTFTQVFAQECVIVDDAVASLTGPITSVNFPNLSLPSSYNIWWVEFSQDATKMVVNTGESTGQYIIETHQSYTGSLPWPFAGQEITLSLREESEAENVSYTDRFNFDADQKFLIKTQIVDNNYVDVWLTQSMHLRSVSNPYMWWVHAKVEFGQKIVFDHDLVLRDVNAGNVFSLFDVCARQTVDARSDVLAMLSFGLFQDTFYNPPDGQEVMGIDIWRGPNDRTTSPYLDGYYGHPRWSYPGAISNEDHVRIGLLRDANQFCAKELDQLLVTSKQTGDRDIITKFLPLNLSRDRVVAWCTGPSLLTDFSYYSVDFLENGDIDAMLSIDGEPDPRIIIGPTYRSIGMLTHSDFI